MTTVAQDGKAPMKVVELQARVPNQDLVKMLEELLKLAMAGEIEGGLFAGASVDGFIHTCWVAGKASRSQILGAVEVVKWDYINVEFERRGP